MADGNFDPCECIWNHENSMQRLMNLLRNAQSYCTDNNCPTTLPGPQGTPDNGGFNMMMVMLGWLVVATALFLFRPRSLRRGGDQKPLPQGPQGGNPPPPTPPVH